MRVDREQILSMRTREGSRRLPKAPEGSRRLPKAPFFLQKGFLSVRENTEHYVVLRSNIW